MNQRIKVIIAFAGVFLAGAVSGGIASHFLLPPKPPINAPRQQGRPPNAEQFHAKRLQELTKRLQLSEAQREQIRPLLNAGDLELRTISRDTRRQSMLVLERLDTEISKFLTPEQQAKFANLRQDQRERLRKHFVQGNQPFGQAKGGETQPPPPPPPEGPGAGPEPEPHDGKTPPKH